MVAISTSLGTERLTQLDKLSETDLAEVVKSLEKTIRQMHAQATDMDESGRCCRGHEVSETGTRHEVTSLTNDLAYAKVRTAKFGQCYVDTVIVERSDVYWSYRPCRIEDLR